MKQIKQFLLLVAMGCMGTADAQVSEKKMGQCIYHIRHAGMV